MSDYALDLDCKDLVADFALAKERAVKLGPAMDDMGQAAVASATKRFESKIGVDGQPWTPSLKNKGETMIRRGHLRDSLTHRFNDDGFVYGSQRVYSALLHFGGTVRPKNAKALAFTLNGKKIFAKSVTIPARPYVGFDSEDVADFTKILRRHIARSFGNGTRNSD